MYVCGKRDSVQRPADTSLCIMESKRLTHHANTKRDSKNSKTHHRGYTPRRSVLVALERELGRDLLCGRVPIDRGTGPKTTAAASRAAAHAHGMAVAHAVTHAVAHTVAHTAAPAVIGTGHQR